MCICSVPVFWYWENINSFESCTPFLYWTVIFINGSVTYYLRRYGILMKKRYLRFVCIVISFKGSVHVCRNFLYGLIFELWFVWQGASVYLRSRTKIRILVLIFREGFSHVYMGWSIYWQMFLLYVGYENRSCRELLLSDETSIVI